MSRRSPQTRAEARARNSAAGSRTRKRWSWKKRILVSILGAFGLGVAGLLAAYALISVPQPNDLATAQASIFYYADGKTELVRLSEIDANRESVDISDIPQHVQQAMVAAEDRTFYDNNGISPQGIARAAWDTLKGSSTAGGGSTITAANSRL